MLQTGLYDLEHYVVLIADSKRACYVGKYNIYQCPKILERVYFAA